MHPDRGEGYNFHRQNAANGSGGSGQDDAEANRLAARPAFVFHWLTKW